MNDLTERLEKAMGPDRELANDLLLACGWKCESDETWVSPEGERWFDHNPGFPNPTASTDAALTLMPKGWRLQLFQRRDGGWFARLIRNKDSEVVAPFEADGSNTSAVNPAIALCIAITKALQSLTQGTSK